MILNKVMMAVVGLSILSAPAAHSGFMDFAKRGFKSCTDNCTANVCGDTVKRAWCVKNCSYLKGDSIKIDMTQVCKTHDLKSAYNPNKPWTDKEKDVVIHMKNKKDDKIIPSDPSDQIHHNHLENFNNAVRNAPIN